MTAEVTTTAIADQLARLRDATAGLTGDARPEWTHLCADGTTVVVHFNHSRSGGWFSIATRGGPELASGQRKNQTSKQPGGAAKSAREIISKCGGSFP